VRSQRWQPLQPGTRARAATEQPHDRRREGDAFQFNIERCEKAAQFRRADGSDSGVERVDPEVVNNQQAAGTEDADCFLRRLKASIACEHGGKGSECEHAIERNIPKGEAGGIGGSDVRSVDPGAGCPQRSYIEVDGVKKRWPSAYVHQRV
jgi:hypothetical protein